MIRRAFIGLVVLGAMMVSLTARAGGGDYVNQVYACSSNIVLIQMQNAGWVYINANTVGQTQVDRVMNFAISLLNSGKKTGYFNNGAVGTVCGLSAAPITVLEMTNDP